jgi:hypothetical protein
MGAIDGAIGIVIGCGGPNCGGYCDIPIDGAGAPENIGWGAPIIMACCWPSIADCCWPAIRPLI